MLHYFILNPAAGKRDRTPELRELIDRICTEHGLNYEIAVSSAPGNCRTLARKAASSGEEVRIYACGGDGPLYEVVSGSVGCPNAAVTHFPGGSGNDFIKIFDDPDAFHDLERLLDCEEAQFDLNSCNDRYALNVCTVGFDARIGTSIARYKRLPLVTGAGAYVLSAVVTTIQGISEHYTLEIDGKVLDQKQTLIFAGNGRFYGGGFHPMPDADPADGLLDVLLVEPVTRRKVLAVIGKYKDGKYAQFPDLIHHLRVKEFTVHCDKPTGFNLDGELYTCDTAHIRVAPEKIRFFYPRGLSWKN